MKQQNITIFQNQKLPISKYEEGKVIIFKPLIKNREGHNLSIQKKILRL